MGKINLHIWFSELFGAIVGSFILSFVLLWIVHLWEYMLPTSFRYEYSSVTPTTDSFKKWELLSFLSVTSRHRSINMERQDTAYCQTAKSWAHFKHTTQRRPVTGTELMTKGERRWIWKYFIKIDEDMVSCMMCWNAIGYTEHNYPKVYSYCTEEFKVNQ